MIRLFTLYLSPFNSPTMYYINSRSNSSQFETIDGFSSKIEALRCLQEYMLCMPEHELWISSRACKSWSKAD